MTWTADDRAAFDEGLRHGDPGAFADLRCHLAPALIVALQSGTGGRAAIDPGAAEAVARAAFAALEPRVISGDVAISDVEAALRGQAESLAGGFAPIAPTAVPADARDAIREALDADHQALLDALAAGDESEAAITCRLLPVTVATRARAVRSAALETARARGWLRGSDGTALDTQFIDGTIVGGELERERYADLVALERSIEVSDGVTRGQLRRLFAEPTAPLGSAGRRGAGVALIFGAMVLIAAVALVFARSGAPESGAGPSLTLFRTGADGLERAPARLAAGDGLLFAYTNPPGSQWRAWFVAARDAAGGAHWLHPARPGPATAAPMWAGVTERQRRVIVREPFASGPLEVCAFFARRKVPIADIRRAFEATGDWPGGERDCVSVEVGDG